MKYRSQNWSRTKERTNYQRLFGLLRTARMKDDTLSLCKSLRAWRRKTDDNRCCCDQQKTMRGRGQRDLRAPSPVEPKLINCYQDAAGQIRGESETARTHMSVSGEGVLVHALCLLHILERGQHKRSPPFANAPRNATTLIITQEGAHRRAPVSTHGKIDVEQQHVCGAREQTRDIPPSIEGARKGRENEVDVCACGEAGRVGDECV